MVSHDGHAPSKLVKELEEQNLLLRMHNLRLLAQLEKFQADAVIFIQVKPGEKQ